VIIDGASVMVDRATFPHARANLATGRAGRTSARARAT
jgi:hypothetical protein